MFRRLPQSLPIDPVFPQDLEQLGYFINDKDQIRKINNPKQAFQYKIDRNDRVNELHREAMNNCVRRIVGDRLFELGIEQLRLPLHAKEHEKHIPILVSKDLAHKQHVIVLVTDRYNDSGVLSHRVIGDEGIGIGSIIGFVKASLKAGSIGLVILNPAQLIWYRAGGRAVSDHEWVNLPRESAVHEPMYIDEERNRVPGNENYTQHVKYVFEHILKSSERGGEAICHPQARFSLVGMEFPVSVAMKQITESSSWAWWKPRISSVAMMTPQHTLQELQMNKSDDLAEEIANFVARRTRAYFLSPGLRTDTLGNRGKDRTMTLGCNCYASGEELYDESVFIRCWPSVLSWLLTCYNDPMFAEPQFVVRDEGDDTSGNEEVNSTNLD